MRTFPEDFPMADKCLYFMGLWLRMPGPFVLIFALL